MCRSRPLSKGVSGALKHEKPGGSVRDNPFKSTKRNDENTLTTCRSRVGDRFCFADLCPTNQHAGSTTTSEGSRDG